MKLFGLVLPFMVSDVTCAGDRIEMSFQPSFDCDSRCMARIGALLKQEIGKVSLDDIAIEAEAEAGRHRRDAAESNDICLTYTKTIVWKKFIERDLCSQVKAQLPQCNGRHDDCIKCYGNGTYVAPYKQLFCKTNPIYNNPVQHKSSICSREFVGNDDSSSFCQHSLAFGNCNHYGVGTFEMHNKGLCCHQKINTLKQKISCNRLTDPQKQQKRHIHIMARLLKCSAPSCRNSHSRRSPKMKIILPMLEPTGCCASFGWV